MSKQALALLAREIAGDSTKYRKQVVYKAGHVCDLRATSISKEMRLEIQTVQPDLLDVLTEEDIKKAASTFRRVFTGLITPKNIEGNIAYQPSYDTMQKKLAQANLAAYAVLEQAVKAKGRELGGVKSANLIQLDHDRTVAETRYAQAFNNTVPDPLAALKALHNNAFLSKDVYDEIYKNVANIVSHYSGNTKVFELEGRVTVKLRSGTANQAEGRKEVNARIAALKEAIMKAKDSKTWADQAASDSYKDFILKSLTNAVVNAGGTGTRQKIDKSSSSATVTTTDTVKVTEYSTGRNTTTRGPQKVAKKPMLTLNTIVNYINSRLPEAMRANMGPESLKYRSGRLSNSARVVNQQQTQQGFPSLGYTYQRSPYDVFDPVLGAAPWNSPGRDPRKLVEKSIRDIAKDLAIGRFYLRRV